MKKGTHPLARGALILGVVVAAILILRNGKPTKPPQTTVDRSAARDTAETAAELGGDAEVVAIPEGTTIAVFGDSPRANNETKPAGRASGSAP